MVAGASANAGVPIPLASVPQAVRATAIAVGFGGLALALAVMVLFPVWETISVPATGLVADERLLGVLLWTAVCLMTSSLGLVVSGQGGINYAFGPLFAAAALGGPAAATFVALFGTFEVRELRGEIPWYGVFFNHGMAVLAWTSTALILAGLRAVAGDAPGSLAGFAMLMAAACVGSGVNLLIGAGFIRLRTGRWFSAALGVPLSAIALLVAGEAALAWLVATAYVGLAWWSALLFILVDAGAAGSLARHRAAWNLRHRPFDGIAQPARASRSRGGPPQGGTTWRGRLLHRPRLVQADQR